MTPCISQVCTLPSMFAEDAKAFAGAGVSHFEIWLTKLEQHLEKNDVNATRRLLNEHNLQPVAASFHGGLFAGRDDAFDHLKKRLAVLEAMQIPVLVIVPDFSPRPDDAEIAGAIQNLSKAGQWAAGFQVKLALEFRGQDPFCNNLATALDLVEACDEANVGICLDAFHFYKGPSKECDLRRLNHDNLFHVQLSDVAGVPREIMSESDRILPGEGDFELSNILQRLKNIEYRGAVSLEVMNPVLWKSKPNQVSELGWNAINQVLNNTRSIPS